MERVPIAKDAPALAIEQAVRAKDYKEARSLMAVKLARMLDYTDSARDSKSICLSLTQLLDKCEADEKQRIDTDTPYAQIMREAESVLVNAG